VIRKTKTKLNDDDFLILREQFISYLRSEYLYGSAETTAPYLRNKFSYTLTLLFLATYESHWPDFFDTIFALLKPPPETGVQPFNSQISIFFFKLLTEISSEVADQLLKNARAFDADRMARDGRIRDLIREKDAPNINQAVLTIIVSGQEKLVRIRAGQLNEKLSLIEEVVDLGVRAFASYVRRSFHHAHLKCSFSLRCSSSLD
jgi:exportin-T